MRAIKIISDFSVQEIPHGGAERVDDVIVQSIGATFVKTQSIQEFDNNSLYILSNISTMPQYIVNNIINYDYILLEHDCKYCLNRNPWMYNKESKVPKNELINLDLYKNAKAIIVQSTDHFNVFQLNGIEGNFINLQSSLWQKEDLNLLRMIFQNMKTKVDMAAIYNSNNWIKNTRGAIRYCENNLIPFDLLPNQSSRQFFLEKLSQYSKLVFFPLARETLCRLVVEARCFDLKIITTNNYGAVLEDWFKKYHGEELISFLEENTVKNLEIIRKIIEA